MKNKRYPIGEVAIFGGNDKVKENLFILFILFKHDNSQDKILTPSYFNSERRINI